MKDRASLAIMEQIIMLLILVLVAGLCLQAFVWADGQSEAYARQDEAMGRLQSAAEVIKSTHGDLQRSAGILGAAVQDGVLRLEYEKEGICVLTAQILETDLPGLGKARVQVLFESEEIAGFDVCYQEVGK